MRDAANLTLGLACLAFLWVAGWVIALMDHAATIKDGMGPSGSHSSVLRAREQRELARVRRGRW